MCEIEFERFEGTLKVLLKGEIDHHSAKTLSRNIDAEIICSTPKRCVLDFSSVGFMDSSGIGLILGRHRLLHSENVTMSVAGVSSQVEKILQIAGITSSSEFKGGYLS